MIEIDVEIKVYDRESGTFEVSAEHLETGMSFEAYNADEDREGMVQALDAFVAALRKAMDKSKYGFQDGRYGSTMLVKTKSLPT